jgi:hypothetical protein
MLCSGSNALECILMRPMQPSALSETRGFRMRESEGGFGCANSTQTFKHAVKSPELLLHVC